jgi:hypothetical protein
MSCNKKDDDNTPTPTPTTNGFFRFKANGTLVEMNSNVYVSDNKTTTALVLSVSATGASGYSVFGGINDFSGAGDYVFESNPSSYILFTINGTVYTLGKALQPKSHGTLTVTGVKNISSFDYTKGTFNGVAYASASDSVVITNGEYQDKNY